MLWTFYIRRSILLESDAGKWTFRYRFMTSSSSLWLTRADIWQWMGFQVHFRHWHTGCYSVTDNLQVMFQRGLSFWTTFCSFHEQMSPGWSSSRVRKAKNTYWIGKDRRLRMRGRCVRLTGSEWRKNMQLLRYEENSSWKTSPRDCPVPGAWVLSNSVM